MKKLLAITLILSFTSCYIVKPVNCGCICADPINVTLWQIPYLQLDTTFKYIPGTYLIPDTSIWYSTETLRYDTSLSIKMNSAQHWQLNK